MSKKIVLDAGHGGSDPGASGNGIVEKELTLKINNYIHKRLNELGIENSVTRDSDATLSPSDRVNKILSFYGNGNDVIVVSNHINVGGGEGAEIIYALRNTDTLSKKISESLESSGREVRKYYQRRLPSNPSKDYYFIHRDTPNTEAIIVEYGFLDNVSDANKLKDNWQVYAEAVVKGLASYIGVPYNYSQTSTPITSSDYYIVKKGDTLYSIAKNNNTSVDNLKLINNLKSNLLSIGQTLKLKEQDVKPDDNTSYYTVKKGDTLYSIAKNNNTTVDDLKLSNNLSSNLLSIGQKLLIPISTLIYEVKKGDTLYGIAKKFNTSVNNLMNLNNLKSTLLSIGQKLFIKK